MADEVDGFRVTVRSRIEGGDDRPEIEGTCTVLGELAQHDGREGAKVSVILETEGASAELTYWFFDGGDGRPEIWLPPTGEPVTDFALCVGTRVGSAVAGAAIRCYRTTSGWRAFLACMQRAAPDLGMSAIRVLFRCAGKIVGIPD